MPSEAKWAISGIAGALLIYAGWHFYPVLLTVHILICFLLVVVVLLQSGNAADLAGAFGGAGSQTAFGPRGAATFLSKATTWCAIMFMLTSMTMVLRQSKQQGNIGSIFERMGTQQSAPTPAQKPVVPSAPTPTQPVQAPASTTPSPAPGTQPPASSAPAPAPATNTTPPVQTAPKTPPKP